MTRSRAVVPAAYYLAVGALLLLAVTGTLGSVFPGPVARHLGQDSEALLLALGLPAWVQYARPRLAGTRAEWPVTGLVAAALLGLGLELIAVDALPGNVETLNEPLLALAVLVPYVQLRRPLPQAAVLALPVGLLLVIAVAAGTEPVTVLAECLAVLVLVPVGLDLVDRGVLQPGARTSDAVRWSWYASLLLAPVAIALAAAPDATGALRYAERVQEAFLGVLVAEAYLAVVLRPGRPAGTAHRPAPCSTSTSGAPDRPAGATPRTRRGGPAPPPGWSRGDAPRTSRRPVTWIAARQPPDPPSARPPGGQLVPEHPHPGGASASPAGPVTDVAVAVQAAQAAAQVLLALRESAAGAPDLKARGDREAQAAIAAVLAELRPDDAVLSEEAADSDVRLSADRVWIVDPLDGTREYGEAPRSDWAVHVALWTREAGDLVTSAVALPALGQVLTTDDPLGGAPAPAPHTGRPRLAVSRSRATETALAVAEQLDMELVPLGSAGYKASAVVLGQVDAYVHTGGQYEWDSAAPVAVARAAGLHTSRVDGSPLVYNRRDPRLPDLVVCRPELAQDVLTVLKQLSPEEA